jgi:NAD+ kinase
MKKYYFAYDKTFKSEKLKKFFLKHYKQTSPHLSNFIVVLGGDGFMLKTLKKYQKYNKPFYGINSGTYGFLMNKFSNHSLEKIISKTKSISISPLEMKATTKYGKTFVSIAINEVSLLRQTRQTASLQVFNKNKTLIKKLICDGIIVSTPAGSTAYNLSVNGPILSLNSKKLAITPISPFRPRRWKGKIVPLSSIIKVKNLNTQKRSISAVADNVEVRDIKSIIIKNNSKIKFKLLYDKNNSLAKKIKLEQHRKKSKYS